MMDPHPKQQKPPISIPPNTLPSEADPAVPFSDKVKDSYSLQKSTHVLHIACVFPVS